MVEYHIKKASSIHEVDPADWDRPGHNLPFQSHRWYAFCERVMADCPPTYLLAYRGENLVARASFWLIRDEPLPDLSSVLRNLAMSLLKRWPLFICRSPIANASGLVLPKGLDRARILSALAQTAKLETNINKASFAIFDYLDEEETRGFPKSYSVVNVSGPGTIMQNRWESLDAFLADGKKKDRQHYKRTMREAKKLGIKVKKKNYVSDIDAALTLISNIDRRYGNPSDPRIRNLLNNMSLVDGTWLEARIGDRLVGTGILFEDCGSQMTTALGLVDEVPYVYFTLIYASLEVAFENKVRLLRWGSGAYEVKENLGFSKTNDNYVMVAGTNPIARTLTKFFS